MHLALPAFPAVVATSWRRRLLPLCLSLGLAAGWLSGCSSLPPLPPRVASTALAQPEQTPLGQLVAEQRKASGTSHRSGFVLLGGAEAAFTSRLALVEAASQTLDLQYYTIHADASTARLLKAVIQAAQRGVRVRVLLDDFHSAGKNAQVMRLAFVPGIEMRMFNPLTGPRNSSLLRALSTLTDFQRAQQRMHNKLFIADNSLGITGGRNLGDAYFDALDSDNFIDLDVLAAGQAVRQLSSSFDRYWNDQRAYPVQSLISLLELQQMRAAAQADTGDQGAQGEQDAPEPDPGSRLAATQGLQIPASSTDHLRAMDLTQAPWIWASAVVLADAPAKIAAPDQESADLELVAAETADLGRANLLTGAISTGNALHQALAPVANQDNVVDGLLALIDHARRDILIVSPYFVPGEDMKQAFARARERGIRLRLLTNSLASNDAPLAHAGYARHRRELLAMGVQLYELRSLQDGRVDPGTLRSSAGQISGSQGGSRAMLHSKLMVIDNQLTVVGSMNLDLRSQLQNTEIGLLIGSRRLAAQATASIERSLSHAAWLVEDGPNGLIWRAPAGSDWGDQSKEPDASLPLRWMIQLIGPLAPDHLL